MVKFGVLLNSRPAGREAYLRLVQLINGAEGGEPIVLDFDGVEILTPSYADELLRSLREKYGLRRILIENANTEVVRTTLDAVQELQPV
jgi:hypothetical protein